jgi:hypothetical protein
VSILEEKELLKKKKDYNENELGELLEKLYFLEC